jgi:DNA mismatch repair ATPase MutS
MSGKTTFLKTLGVNQILAQTFNFCCAEEAEITFCNVVSSMRRDDDLSEGKSFYLGEVERVKKLIDLVSEKDEHFLFLLDEIYRGTNTIERISASKEVLKWLNRPQSFVLASTHDLELVDLLSEEYSFFHFVEEVGEQSLSFDYKIKPGHSSTKNAIKLLEIWDYPNEIVEGALDVSHKLEREGVINMQINNSRD